MRVNSVDFKFVSQDQREALYDEIWTDPVITVAKRYGISDNSLRKHCKRLGIPRACDYKENSYGSQQNVL